MPLQLPKNAALEGLKESLRVAAFEALGVVSEALISGTFSWRLTFFAAGIAALKGFDKYWHVNPNLPGKGILPF